ncbi:hypothetical protein [Noviherbaspirillum aridicola]|nr:hypothetical protein [Noviherbaspirillum aridicola]
MAIFDDDRQRKAALFLLAAASAFIAGAGLQLLLLGAAPMDAVKGGGRVLFWGGITAALLARVHGRTLPGISLATWTGAGLIIVSWW